MTGSLAFLLLTSLGSTWATSIMPQPFPDMVSDSQAIVRGKVGQSYSNWGEALDRTRRLFTFTEIQVAEVMKGSGGLGLNSSSIMARELGGEKDGSAWQVSGVAEFKKSEDVVVMLGAPNADGSRDVRGMMMGKFNVVRDDSDGQEYLEGAGINSFAEPREAGPGKNPFERPGPPKRWSLTELRTLVQTQATKPGPTNGAPVKSTSQLTTPAVKSPPVRGVASTENLENGPSEKTSLQLKLALAVLLGGGVFFLVKKVFKRRS